MAKTTTGAAKGAAITAGQIKKIHTLKGALGFDDEDYRAVLFGLFRKASSKDLNYTEAEEMIQHLERTAVKAGVWEKRTESKKFDDWEHRRGGMATPAQLRKIEAMWKGLSRATDQESREKALRSFIDRVAKVSALRFLDQEGATKVINAMNAMAKSAEKKAKPATSEKAV